MMVLAQENATPKKVAVYVASNEENVDNTTKSIVGSEIVRAIVKTKKYQAVERTADFLKQIGKEQGYQRSGNVDDGQISALGKQFGVNFVCVADVMPFGDKIYIQARLIDVETATVLEFARETSSSSDMDQIIAASEKVAFAIVGFGGSSSSYSSPSQTSRTSAGQGKVIEIEAHDLVNSNEESAPSSVKDNLATSPSSKVGPNVRGYNVFAFGVGKSWPLYSYSSKYNGTTVEYRIIYKSQKEMPEFKYLGTTPFAYCTENDFGNIAMVLSIYRHVIKDTKTFVVENADDVACVEFRLSKDGYETVVVQPSIDGLTHYNNTSVVFSSNAPVMYINLKKLKPLK